MIHHFVATFGVNDTPIYKALSSQLVWPGRLILDPGIVHWIVDTGSQPILDPLKERSLKSLRNLCYNAEVCGLCSLDSIKCLP